MPNTNQNESKTVTIFRSPATRPGSVSTAVTRQDSIGGSTRRRPMLTRISPADLPAFRITNRDRAILYAVRQCRVLTTTQIEMLLFSPRAGQEHRTNTSNCQYRLQQLYHRGYLDRDEQPQKLSDGRKPYLYVLDRAGARLLAALDKPDGAVPRWSSRRSSFRPLFLEHLLATNDVRVSLTVASRDAGVVVARWLDEPELRQHHSSDRVTIAGPKGGTVQTTVVPDGYFVLTMGERETHQFLEIDRGTVTGERSVWGTKDWARKVAAYLAYYHAGHFRRRYRTRSLRILTVTTSDQRLENLLAITERVSGKARFWFTTFARLRPASVLTQPIWRVASLPDRRPLITG